MNNPTCAVLVNSCDKYKDAWHPFFTLLKKYWSDCPYPLYLSTETLSCHVDGVSTINCPDKTLPWSDRLLHTIQAIEAEYIILFLEDFFLMGKVKQREIAEKISIMEQETDIAAFYFKHSTGQAAHTCEYGQYIKMNTSKKYILNFQAGLWRKSALLALIKPGLSPWEIEENPSPSLNAPYRFYCPKDGNYTDCTNDVFPYLWALRSGYGICKSKWLWNNKKLFKKEGIQVNFKSLGKMRKISYDLEILRRKIKNKLKK